MENVVYDLNMYKPSANQPKIRQVNSKATKEKQNRISVRNNRFDLIVMAAVCVVLIALMLVSNVKYNEACSELDSAKSTLVQMVSVNDSLTREVENKMSSSSIDEYAIHTLGMIKLDSSQIQYINLEKGNMIEVKSSNFVFDHIKAAAASIIELLGL